jgi:predicted nucleic acid-binding protein
VRHSHSAAADFLRTVTTSESLHLHWVTPDRFHAAAAFFTRHDDKDWSFTDCVSFELMHDLNVCDSFTTDLHFRQAGFNPLLAVRKR